MECKTSSGALKAQYDIQYDLTHFKAFSAPTDIKYWCQSYNAFLPLKHNSHYIPEDNVRTQYRTTITAGKNGSKTHTYKMT